MLWLFLAGLITRLVFINFDAYFHTWDEQYHALVAKNMSENPFVPMLFKNTPLDFDPNNWTANHVWLHKQPLFLWQIALSIKLFGNSFFAVRLPSAIMSALLIPVIFRIGKLSVNEHVGYIAAFLFAVSNFLLDLPTGMYNTDHNDVAFIFYVALSFWAFTEYKIRNESNYIWLIGLFAGCAIMNKWLVGFVVFSGWGVSTLFIEDAKNKLSELKNIIKAFGICILIFVPWQVYLLIRFPKEIQYEYAYSSKHFFEVLENHSGNWGYHFEQAIVQYGWFAAYILPIAFIVLLVDIKNKLVRVSFLTYVVLIYLFFTISKTKMPVFCLILAPIMFTALGNLLFRVIDYLQKIKTNKMILKTSEFILIALIGVISINIEKVQANHTSWIKSGDRVWARKEKTRAAILAKSIEGKFDKEKTIIINCNATDNIPIMFFSNYTAYDKMPAQDELSTLKSKGYQMVYINNFEPIVDYIKKDPEVIIIDNSSKTLVVNFKAGNGKFVCANEQFKDSLCANRNEAGNLETFYLIMFEDNECAIRSHDDHFLCSEINQNGKITATRNKIGGWETFTLVNIDSNHVAFKACNGKYLSLDEKIFQLYAKSDAIGKNETFEMILK